MLGDYSQQSGMLLRGAACHYLNRGIVDEGENSSLNLNLLFLEGKQKVASNIEANTIHLQALFIGKCVLSTITYTSTSILS